MQLRHSTTACNVPSILTKGPGPSYAVTESEKKHVWLHTPQRTPWAIQYTVRRKKVSEDEDCGFGSDRARELALASLEGVVEMSGCHLAASPPRVGSQREVI